MKIYDLEQPHKAAEKVKVEDASGRFDSDNFNPHGLSIWQDKKTGMFCW